MDFSAEGILERMKGALKSEDTRVEGSFSMDNLQAVSEEMARFHAMRIVPLMEELTDREEDMGTSGNEKHYVRWAKEATDGDGNRIVGNAKVNSARDGSGVVNIAILTTEARVPSEEQIRVVQAYIDSNRPVGAEPVVMAAEGVDITIKCIIKVNEAYSKEAVESYIYKSLQTYFTTIAFATGTIILNYYTICGIVSDKTDGVLSLESLTVNGKMESITAAYNRFFVLKEVVVNVIK